MAIINGTDGADVLEGGAENDVISGLGGNDTINAAGGSDVVFGGSGSDAISGGSGADVFGFDGDPFDGGNVSAPGRQFVGREDFISDFAFNEDAYLFDAKDFVVSGQLTFQSLDATASGAAIRPGVNFIVLTNSDNDGNTATSFNAGSAANQVAALVSTDGSGFIVYYNSVLNLNRLIYSTNLNDPTADVKIVSRHTDLTGQAAIDALASFTAANFRFQGEALMGGDGAETLSGFGGADVISGDGGNDTILGRGGADMLSGEIGDDIVSGGDGDDRLDGGIGIDTADYSSAGAGVTVTLASSRAQNTRSAGSDTLSGFENLIGSGFEDRLFGDGGNNRIEGGDGNDSIYGGDGNDNLFGGGGADGFQAGAGADLFDGGLGVDVVTFSGGLGATVFLDSSDANAGAAVGDTFEAIENLVGSLIEADVLVGDGAANRLVGQGGGDRLVGRGGIDQL